MLRRASSFIENRKSDWTLAKFVARSIYAIGVELRPGVPLSPGLLLERHAAQQAGSPGLLFEDRRYSYAELNAAVNQAARALEGIGVKHGDVIALMMDNRPEYIFAVLGANKIGAVPALINTHVVGKQLEHALSIARPRWLLAGSEHMSTLSKLGSALPVAAERLIVWPERQPQRLPDQAIDFQPLFEAASRANPAQTASNKGEDSCCFIYTSGTTGFPKAVVFDNRRALQSSWIFSRAAVKLSPSDIHYTSGLPLYHSSGMMLGVLAALAGGAGIAMRRKFSVSEHWSDVAKFDATVFVYVGELLRYLNNAPPHPEERNHRLRAIMGAGLRPEIWDDFVERFEIPRVYEIYGATEAPTGSINLDNKPGVVGRMMPGQQIVRTIADTAEPERDREGCLIPCEIDEPGLLVSRFSRVSSFDGYLDESENRSKIIENAFGPGKHAYNSGDLLKRDARGYLSFEDRLGDTFRWKGENVATNELGDLLVGCPGVSEANVYGVRVPHNDGRAGMVALVTERDFDMDVFAEFVRSRLPAYSRPLFVRFEEQMELTATFKYVKTHFKEQGYDPKKCGKQVLFLYGDRYVPLDEALLDRLEAGVLKL